MNNKTKTITVLASAAVLTPLCAFGLSNVHADAVTIAKLNSSELFVKQHTSYTCTLSSNTMLLRRAMMLKGGDWQSITEESCRYSFWIEGIGMPFSYTYQGIHVESKRIYGSSAETLKEMLKQHPEGVVAYDYDHPHAILLTDYTDGKFYCADPANCVPDGRVEASLALIDVNGIEDCWYVTDNLPRPVDSEIVNNSTISSTKVSVGASIILNGKAEGSEGAIKYSFYCKKGTGSYSTIKSTATSAEYIPSEDGNYSFKVVAEDKSGYRKEKEFSVNVCKKPELTLNVEKQIDYGDEILIKADAKNGTGTYQYEINAVKPSGASVNLRKYCSLSELKYHPYEFGNYQITVNVKDSSGVVASKTVTFKVVQGQIKNTSTASTKKLNYGEDIIFNASAKGGTGGYQYKYTLIKPCGLEVTLKKFSTVSVIKYHPYEVGTYKLKLVAKDKNSNTSTKVLIFNVEMSALKNLSYVKTERIKYGESVAITGSATGGMGGYQYRVDAQKPCGDNVTLLNYTPYKVFTYRPWERGTYTIRSTVKDKDGNVATQIIKLIVD